MSKPFARNVRWKNGAWRFRVPKYLTPIQKQRIFDNKSEYTLGKDLSSAAAKYAEITKEIQGGYTLSRTIGDLLDRYTVEVVPLKRPATSRNNLISIQRLKGTFGHIPVWEFKTPMAFEYRARFNDRKVAANRDLEVLSHLFSKAIEWGVISNDQHPLRGLRYKNPSSPRCRYVEDWEVQEALKVASPFLSAYIQLKLTLGLRKGDMLSLKLSDRKDDGIHVLPSKTADSSGKRTIYTPTPARLKAWEEALSVKPKRGRNSDYLFCTRDGEPYLKEDGQSSGFDSQWQRFMRKAIQETDLKSKFTENDLRAKVASDSDSDEQARKRLGHSSAATTKRHYRRKGEVAD